MAADGSSGAERASDGATSLRANLRPLRDYQREAIDKARAAFRSGKRAIVLVAPTGSGKTRLGVECVIGAMARGGSVLWLAHRDELIMQARNAIIAEGVDPSEVGIIAADFRRTHARIQVASVQTLLAQSRRGRKLPTASLVIPDECHHYVAEDWCEVLAGIRDTAGNMPKVLGLTATPERGDGRPLGDMFDALIPVSSVRELQALGVLVPCVTYAPETHVKALAREPIEAYREHGCGERCFVFCVTVAHAEMIAETFRVAGVSAATIHANTPWALRRARLEAFRSQDANALRKIGSAEDAPLVICNVYTLTEGVDVPEASVAITARGIGHGGMMRQMIGRVLRAAPGKDRAIWWDLRGQHHKKKIGLPEADCVYSLEGKAITVAEAPDDPPRTCKGKACGAVFMTWAVDKATGGRRCPSCAEPAPALAIPEVKDREVFAAGSGASERDRLDAIERLAMTACDRGYRPGWVTVRYQEQFHEMPPRGSVDAAYLKARKTLGIKVSPGEVEAEREKLYAIARERNIPLAWVAKKIAEKYGEDAA